MLEEAPPPVARDTTKRSALGVLPACTLLAVACCGLVASAVASPLGPPHPAMLPGNFARNIRNLECVSRKTQEKGTCMFALSCLKLNGTHLGVCVDRFYYGSCCRLPDLDQEVDIGGGDSNDISAGGLLKPVTAANVAEIDASPSTARPLTTLVTKVPAKVTTTTTVRPLKPVATAAPTKKPAATPPPFTAATPTKKPVVVTSAKPVTSATTKPQPKPTPAATTPVKKPPVAATTAKPAALVTNATTTAKPQKPTTVNKPVTKPPTVVTKPPTVVTKPPTVVTKPPAPVTKPPAPVTKPPAPVTKPPVAVTKPTPVTKPPTLATKPPVILTKPTQKPTAAATKPTQKPITTAKPTVKPTPVTSKPVTTSTSTVSNEVSSKPVTTATSRPIIEAVEEETNALSEGQKPSTARPTPPSFSGSSSSAKPSPPTFPSSVSTSRPTPPTFPNTSAKPVESSAKPVTSVTTAKPLNSTDENWVQIQLSTTSPAPAKPTPTYPDGSLFTEEIPAGVSRPTPPTFAPVSQTTTTTESGDLMAPPLNMSDYKQVCGRRLLPDGRIVGGTRSTFAKWPWQISLRQWRTSTYLHKCGAALLNENWAITAAHCVENVPPSDLLLRLGEHDLSTESEAHPHLERRVQIVASHPQFDSRTFEYDLALLRFYEPVVFQPNVIPICIPQDDKNYVGENAYVTGWGRLYEDGPLPSVMQEVSVPVLENAVCETMYRSAGYIEHIPNIFICAGWKKGGFDSCEGDSGGPMVIQRDDKRWTLAGVISWGIGCAEPNQPGVYTRISAFKDWINQILQF